MKVLFTTDFKNSLKVYGNNIKLSVFRLGRIEIGLSGLDEIREYCNRQNSLSEYLKFESLWFEEDKTLNMTLDFNGYTKDWVTSFLEEPYGTKRLQGGYRTVIFVYYSDQNDNIIDLAFILCGDEEEILGKKSRSPLYLRSDGGLNHITVYFPSYSVVNILRNLDNEDVEYIENKSNITGVNTFLASEGEFNDTDLLTKNSYCRFLRQKNSLKNSNPLYLDSNGEKVYSITTYKHYKSITIKSSNVIGSESTDYPGNYVYYVGNGNSAIIEGTCVYDLYQVINGNYVLIKSDCKEGLINTTIVQTDSMLGGISSTKTDNYNIDQNSKVITFSSTESKIEKTFFIADLSFRSEIGDTKGTQILIKSNVVQFITYLKWSVEYSSNLGQLDDEGNSHIVLLFDTGVGSNGWNPDGGTNKPGTIVIFSESKIDKSNINITAGSSELDQIFEKYFSVYIDAGVYDEINRRYKYTISITTLQSTASSEKWYPLKDGASTLILNTINIVGADSTTKEEAKFYCVQRVINPLSISTFISNSWTDNIGELTFPGTLGVKSLTHNYVVNSAESYTYWEASLENSDIVLEPGNNQTVMNNINPNTENGFSIYTKKSCGKDKTTAFSSITFKRRNSSKSYNPNNWLDLIYCHSDNDVTLKLNMEADTSNSVNNWVVDSSTKYFYAGSDNKAYRLYLFNRSDTEPVQSFTVTSGDSPDSEGKFKNLALGFEDSTISNYFSISFSSEYNSTKDNCTTTVYIEPKKLGSEYPTTAWYPKIDKNSIGSYTPVAVYFQNSSYKETFYCVIKPITTDSIKFYTFPDIKECTSLKYLNSEIPTSGDSTVRTKSLYVTSSVGSIDNLNYWSVFSKDLEININTDKDNYGYGTQLITSQDSTKWAEQGSIVTYITTASLPTDTIDFSLDDLCIRRIASKYESEIGMMKDWRNQLTEDVTALKIEMEGKSPTKTLQVFVPDNNGILYEIKDESPLKLDHIGLYKIFVKSTDKYRVSLEDTNSLDHFYFYDPDKNVAKKDILSIDEGSFNTVTGKEVCFCFFGNEKDTFSVVDQTLRTYITVINLGDNTSIYIPIYRKYYLSKTSDGSFSSPVIDTNIKMNGSSISSAGGAESDIFLPDSSSTNTDLTIKFKSYLETITSFEKMSGVNIDDSSIVIDGDNVTLDYNTYASIGKVVRNNVTSNVLTRGYLTHYSTIKFNNPTSPDLVYPISVLGRISVINPNRFNNERIRYLLYKLLPPPNLTVNKVTVSVPYLPLGEVTVNSTITKGGFYTIEYCPSGGTTYVKLSQGNDLIDNNVNVSITSVTEKENETAVVITIRDITNTELDGSTDLNIGVIRITSYVDHNKFIKDEAGLLITDSPYYTQDSVNALVPPKVKSVNVIRRCKINSKDAILGDTTAISKDGEKRTFSLYKVNDDEVVVTNTALTEQSTIIRNIEYTEDGSLTVDFKSKLERHGYSTTDFIPIRHQYDVSSSKYIFTTAFINNLVTYYTPSVLETDDFYIYCNNAKVTTSGIVQKNWEQGIRIDNKLILGTGNVITNTLEYDNSGCSFYLSGVKLPTSTDRTTDNYFFTVIDTPKIVADDPLIVTVGKVLNKDEYDDESPHFGYLVTVTGIPKNSGTAPLGPYKITISDDYTNSVTYNIMVSQKDTFVVRMFNKFHYTNSVTHTGAYVATSEEIKDDLVFSASGALRNPSKYIYVITDSPTYGVEPTFVFDTITSAKLYDTTVSMTNVSSTFNSYVVSQTSIGKAKIVDNTTSSSTTTTGTTIYNLYEVELFSKVSKISFGTTDISEINITKYMGHSPYTADNRLYIQGHLYGSYIETKNSMYGVCSLQLSSPYTTYLNCSKWEYVEGSRGGLGYWVTFTSPAIVHQVNFSLADANETKKYSAGSSYFLSNNKSFSDAGYYNRVYTPINNTIYVNYLEQKAYKYGKKVANSADAFPTYGYYCGFILIPRRMEWIYNPTTSKWVPTLFDEFAFSNDSELKLVVKTDTDVTTTIYHDEMLTTYGQRGTNIVDPNTGTSTAEYKPTANTVISTLKGCNETYTYSTTNGAGVTIVTPDVKTGSGNVYCPVKNGGNGIENQSYFPVILFEMKESEFTNNSKVYTIKTDKVIKVRTESINSSFVGDDVSFNINIVLKLNI